MNVASLEPLVDKKVSFDPRYNMFVPETPGCYILSTMYDEVLYIGETNNLRRRMSEHLDDSRITGRTYLGLATWFNFRELPCERTYPTEQNMLSQFTFKEGRWPLLNRKGP